MKPGFADGRKKRRESGAGERVRDRGRREKKKGSLPRICVRTRTVRPPVTALLTPPHPLFPEVCRAGELGENSRRITANTHMHKLHLFFFSASFSSSSPSPCMLSFPSFPSSSLPRVLINVRLCSPRRLALEVSASAVLAPPSPLWLQKTK